MDNPFKTPNPPNSAPLNKEDRASIIRDAVLAAVVQHIQKEMAPTHIYFMARRTTAMVDISNVYNLSGEEVRPPAYWLFAVTEHPEEKSAKRIAHSAARENAISLCLCHATVNHLRKQLLKGNRFITHVLQHGQLLYTAHHALEIIAVESAIPIDYNPEVRPLFARRYQRAASLLEAAKAAHDNQIVALVSLAMALEQICLGLLYGVWQYVPKTTSLAHLLQLCHLFWPKIMDYYPQTTPHDRFLFQLITNRPLRKLKQPPSIDPIDVEILLRRTQAFLEEGREFVEEVI
jgi:hypothetical protein